MSLQLVADIGGYRRTMTCQNGTWDGHDLTHQFLLDDRSTVVYGPSQNNTFEQEASLRMVPAQPALAPQMPPQIVTHSPWNLATSAPTTPTFCVLAPAPHMVFQTSQGPSTLPQPMQTSREPSGTQALPQAPAMPPVPNPDLTGKSTAEQAVITALQAVANYPDTNDFVNTVQQRIPGLAALLQLRQEPSSNEPVPPVETTPSPRDESQLVAGPSDESRKRSQRGQAAALTPMETDSPTSHPPPDKQRPVLRSVVIPVPPKVGYRGPAQPQMCLNDAINEYGDPTMIVPESSAPSSVPLGTSAAITTTVATTAVDARPSMVVTTAVPTSSTTTPQVTPQVTPNEPTEVPLSSYLPPSDDVSGSVVTRDSKRIWDAAEILDPARFVAKKRCPPNDADQLVIRQYSLVAHITRPLPVHNADLSEQAWEQRARNRLPRTRNNYMTPLQSDPHAQFPARYSLREGETWDANARYARKLAALRPLLKSVLQRASYCIMVDSTFRSDMAIDNLMPDVMVATMPLARLPEMAEVVVAIFAPELTSSLREPPPQRVIFANVLDHMACEGLLGEIDNRMQDSAHPERAGELLQLVANAMEIAAEILRGQLGISALFVSPPGFMYWGKNFQQFVCS